MKDVLSSEPPNIPGQAGRLQTSVVVADPAHSLPPLAGAGLLHSLVLFRIPLPQVTEQTPSSNLDQSPSTRYKMFMNLVLSQSTRIDFLHLISLVCKLLTADHLS